MKNAFRKGFLKSASHVLAEMSFNMDNSENQLERQAILEDSYDRETGRAPKAIKKDKVTKEEPTQPSNAMYSIGRY